MNQRTKTKENRSTRVTLIQTTPIPDTWGIVATVDPTEVTEVIAALTEEGTEVIAALTEEVTVAIVVHTAEVTEEIVAHTEVIEETVAGT